MAAMMLVAMLPAASVRPAKAQYIVRITLKWETERFFVRDDRYGNYIGYFDVEYDNNGEPFYRIGEEIHYITDKNSIERIREPGNEVVIEVDLQDRNDERPFPTGLEFRDAGIDMRYFQYEVATWTSNKGETVIESNRPLWQIKSLLDNDLVLYPATWRKLPNITYHNTYNGEVYESGGGYTESAYPEIFKYPYHYLLGWSETEGGELKYHPGDEIPGESKQKTEHMDLYSVWGQSRISDIPPVMVRDKNEIERYWFGGHYWRKIGAGADKILLIYDEEMRLGDPHDVVYYSPQSLYARILEYNNELYEDGFSAVEQSAVCSTDKEAESCSTEPIALEDAKVFLISWLEAKTYFADDKDRMFEGTFTNRWWLRGDLYKYFFENYSLPLVSEDGKISSSPDKGTKFYYYFDNFGIVFTAGERPAFVLDLNAVLFTSAEVEVKNATPTDGSSFGSAKYSYENDGMRKITLQDEIYKDFKATINSSNNNQGRIGVTPGETLSVSYENALTDTEDIKNRYISAMLCNRYGEVIGYASMKPAASSGTWELTLPQNLNIAKEQYSLKIFNEQQNGYGCSDYGSPFSVFTLGKPKEATPDATFTATGADSGILSGLTPGANYQVNGSYVDDGLSPKDVADSNGNIEFASGLSEGILSIVKLGNGTMTLESDTQTINVTKAQAPEGLSKTDCTNASNNNGMITGTTDAMEYRKVGNTDWTPCSGQTVEGLTNGTYYVRVKAAGAVLASEGTEVTVAESGITQDDAEMCTVVWLNGDGKELDRKTYIKGGVVPMTDKVPTKAADTDYTYAFDDWDNGTTDGTITIYEPVFKKTKIDPGTTDPGTTDPGTTDPGTTDPGTTDPGTTDPGTTDPGTTDPGTTDPGTTTPGATDPGTTTPGATETGATDPGTMDPGTTDSGATDPSTTDPGATNPGTTTPDTSTPGKTDGNTSENVNGNANENPSGNEIKYDSPDGNVIEWAEGDGPVEKTVKRSEHDELCFPSYVETLVDGEKKDVPARQGSTIITLEESLLKTLSVGTHTITVVFVDGKAEVKLIIKEPAKSVAPATPVTGDALPVVPLAVAMIVTFAGAAGIAMCRRRKLR